MTDPPAGETLDALPPQLTLTFSGALLAEPGATHIEVVDAAGDPLTTDDPVVSSHIVTQTLDGAATGAVTVQWRVVSGDGHPISGEYSFTVAGTSPPTPPAATSTPSPAPAETTEPAPAQTVAPVEDEPSAAPWIVGGIVVAALAAAAAYLVISRRRRGR